MAPADRPFWKRGGVPRPAGSEIPPPGLDRAGGVLAFDVDALFGRKLELHVVIEQTAIGCV